MLTDAARQRASQKRGGAMQRVTLSGADSDESDLELHALDFEEAFESLAELEPRYARIVELRYFAGLSIDEVAKVLGVTRTIIDREWAKARAYLAVRLEDREAAGEG